MKKYFIGLLAIAIALGSAAFTTIPHKTDTHYYFPVDATNSTFTSTTIPDSQTSPLCGKTATPYCSSGLSEAQVNHTGSNVSPKTGVVPSAGLPDLFNND